jgi:hypothetical protein
MGMIVAGIDGMVVAWYCHGHAMIGLVYVCVWSCVCVCVCVCICVCVGVCVCIWVSGSGMCV